MHVLLFSTGTNLKETQNRVDHCLNLTFQFLANNIPEDETQGASEFFSLHQNDKRVIFPRKLFRFQSTVTTLYYFFSFFVS